MGFGRDHIWVFVKAVTDHDGQLDLFDMGEFANLSVSAE